MSFAWTGGNYPEPESFNGDEPPNPQDDRQPQYDQEAARERLHWAFEVACREFAAVEGWPAVVRAVGRAMDQQPELIEK
jgi:hypothetical protein